METPIRCIAVDDEAPALKIIEQFVSETPFLQLQNTFRNPLKATEWLEQNTTDVLFLDIQMPQQSGLEMLKALKRRPVVIFTTAFSEFATDAFDLDAADYLRKPFSYDRFLKAVHKAKDHLTIVNRAGDKPETPVAGENYMTVRTDGSLVKLFFEEIVYMQAFQEYIKIYTVKDRYIIYERMKNMEALLPTGQFMRVHRSYIVALKRAKSISGQLLNIEGHQIPVSKDLKEEVIKRAF